ncbi:hypothetical protein chiPu_0028742, partial [Chiloscyllium punctatum]|nr:hypothetical protein [Chiloscyllium punctatum]
AFQQEITLNTTKIDQLIVSGERLIWKIEPMDAVTIEEELEELHAYCQEVFGRVARFHQRLMSKRPVRANQSDLFLGQGLATLGGGDTHNTGAEGGGALYTL